MDYESAPEVGRRVRILGGEGTELGEIVDSRASEDGGDEYQVKDGERDLGWFQTGFLEVIKED